MNTDEIKQKLAQIAEKYEADESEVNDRFGEAVQDVRDNYAIPASDEEIASSALSIVSSQYLAENRVPGGSEVVDGLTIGADRIWEWNVFEDGERTDKVRDVLVANALVKPTDGPIGLATIYFDAGDGIDVYEMRSMFSRPLQEFTGSFGLTESDYVDGYRLYSRENMEFEEKSTEFEWGDMADRVHFLRQRVEKAELSNITRYLSKTRVLDDGSKRPADHGIDIKRVKGTIVDRYVADDKSYANFSIHDDTIFDETDLEGTPVGSEKQRTRGLTCWVDPAQAEYGVNSVCDFYGTITMDEEAKVQMNVRGIVPLMPRPAEDGSSGTSTEV